MNDRSLDLHQSACWTCLRRRLACDGTLPHCQACQLSGLSCRGFGVRPKLPASLGKRRKRHPSVAAPNKDTPSSTLLSPGSTAHPFPSQLSSLALPTQDSFLMQHFIHNVARIALAVDYSGNGYRSLLAIAVHDEALMNAMLAVAASHYSRWQNTPDLKSRDYLRTSMSRLGERIRDESLVRSSVTLASMLLLATYEVFAGSDRWQRHYNAIQGWIRARGDCSDIDPFLKSWVCMLSTQCALNLGCLPIPELDGWMDSIQQDAGTGSSIDALFGCSSKLPRLMYAASNLYVELNQDRDHQLQADVIDQQAESLQNQIRATQLPPNSDPLIGLLCESKETRHMALVDLQREELRRRMVATAEIFRHAFHIYVYRITHGPEIPLSPEYEASLVASLNLLPTVPDVLGPGATLGWCLVVIGAELDLFEQRDYIRSRWNGLNLLGIHNSKNAQKILEVVWNQRDLFSQGLAIPQRWQDVMQHLGESQILL